METPTTYTRQNLPPVAEMEYLKATYGPLYETQLNLEFELKAEAEAAMRAVMDEAAADSECSQTQVGKRLISFGFEDARKAVLTWWEELVGENKRRGQKPAYTKPILEACLLKAYGNNPQRVVDMLTGITMLCVMDVLKEARFSVNILAMDVTREIFEEARMEAFLQTLDTNTLKGVLAGISHRSERSFKVAYCRGMMQKNGFTFPKWNLDQRRLLGWQLIELVALGSSYFTLETKDPLTNADIPCYLEPTEWLLDAWEKGETNLITYAARFGPMVIPPRPWTTPYDGGYYGELIGRHRLVRVREKRSEPSKAYFRRLGQTDLSRITGVINTIQGTPWRINKQVFEVLDFIISSCNGGRGGVPLMEPLPKLPRLEDPTEEELKEYKKKAFERHVQDSSRASLAIRSRSHLETARKYLGYEEIYFPYNMDFRGRVYPISFFSPQSDDINKGLLEFSGAVPGLASEDDVNWLMIHGANVAGVDKVPFEARMKWVLEHEETILAVALDPIECRFWETDGFENFQFLAFCFEWARLREYQTNHGTSIGFISRLPIAFDGTCSGLQHYSAILRDPVGAKAVNLMPGDAPNDIYGQVAKLVNEVLEVDAMKGDADQMVYYPDREEPILKLGSQTLAQTWLNYGVNRKVCKRSVMTLAYGSRQYGFKENLLSDIIQPRIDKGDQSVFTPHNRKQMAAYLAKLIWNAVQHVVVAAIEGMDFLQAIAKQVANDGHCVTWVSPMGLPIQQTYLVMEQSVIQLRLRGGIRRWAYKNEPTDVIDRHSQASGIAPNFIHSLDACHLQMTVENLAENHGLQHFALIHDSYGCPAAQAQVLFQGIREMFFKLYSENSVMEDFKMQMELLVEKPEELPKAPRLGSFELSEVLNSKYMFA